MIWMDSCFFYVVVVVVNGTISFPVSFIDYDHDDHIDSIDRLLFPYPEKIATVSKF